MVSANGIGIRADGALSTLTASVNTIAGNSSFGLSSVNGATIYTNQNNRVRRQRWRRRAGRRHADVVPEHLTEASVACRATGQAAGEPHRVGHRVGLSVELRVGAFSRVGRLLPVR